MYANLVENIQVINLQAKVVAHPKMSDTIPKQDKDTFSRLVFNPDSPITWNILQDYIQSDNDCLCNHAMVNIGSTCRKVLINTQPYCIVTHHIHRSLNS